MKMGERKWKGREDETGMIHQSHEWDKQDHNHMTVANEDGRKGRKWKGREDETGRMRQEWYIRIWIRNKDMITWQWLMKMGERQGNERGGRMRQEWYISQEWDKQEHDHITVTNEDGRKARKWKGKEDETGMIHQSHEWDKQDHNHMTVTNEDGRKEMKGEGGWDRNDTSVTWMR